jgi:hypothetical protein
MLHLTTALIAAREGRTAEVATHLDEARSLAAHTGERNHMRHHFGPTNVTAWELGLAVEAGTGPGMAERLAAAPIDLSVFDSKGRVAYVYFDLARAWAQADDPRDDQALRALDGVRVHQTALACYEDGLSRFELQLFCAEDEFVTYLQLLVKDLCLDRSVCAFAPLATVTWLRDQLAEYLEATVRSNGEREGCSRRIPRCGLGAVPRNPHPN